MKIGIDIRAIGKKRTGDETYTLNLAKNLLEIDHQNHYRFYVDSANLIELDKIKEKLGISKRKNVEIVSVLPSSKALWTPFFLPKELFNNPVDVFHTQYIVPPFLPKKTKLVTTIHDISFARFPEFISRQDRLLLDLLIPFSLRKAERIIAVSKFTKDEIIDFYEVPKEKITVVYNGGASENFFQPVTKKEKERIRKKYNLSTDYILYVGTLQPRKNIPFLLKAFAEFQKRYMSQFGKLELALTGEIGGHNFDKKITDTLEQIKQKNLNAYKAIKFIGFVEEKDLSGLFQSAKAFSTASWYEGFGLPLIEAMANGVPVICAKDHCFIEIAGGAALYFSQNNVDEFCQKLLELLTDEEKKEELVLRGKAHSREFSWKKCAEETLAVYHS